MRISEKSQPLDAGGRTRGKTLSIPAKHVILTAYSLLIIPILIFFIGWLKWYLTILFSVILLFGAIWMIKKDYWSNTDEIEVPIFQVVLIVGLFGLWIAFSGSCGIGAPVTNGDLPYRNAMLRDLVEYDWPVYYPEVNGNLCYYYIFWMIPALLGKLIGLSGAFAIQWVWMLLIVSVSFLLIAYLFKDYSAKALWMICSFIIFWSGMNLVGTIICEIWGQGTFGVNMSTMEGWCDAFGGNGEPFEFLYRSNQDTLCQIYNQIPFWLAAPLFMQNRKIHNYAMLGLLIFPFSPWGTIGLGVLMIIDAVHIAIIEKSPRLIIAEIFSIQNLCAIFSILVVFGLFFTANSKTQSASGGGFGMLSLNEFDSVHIIEIILFWLMEFGIYWLLIQKKFKNDFLFKALVPVLMLIPLFWIGGPTSRDFCMNVSQPALYLLMIYMIEYTKDEVAGRPLLLKNFVLIMCLASAACSPIFDFGLKAKVMYANQSLAVKNDWFYTYSNKNPETVSNQVAEHAGETVFFKYLAEDFERISPVSKNLVRIDSITDIDEYCDYLAGKNCTVYIAVQDIQGYSLRQETVDKMKRLGFDDYLDLLMQHEYHSFIGIVNDGEIIVEHIGGDEYISYSSELNGYPVNMESATLNKGNSSTICIRGQEYSLKERGLNIVVRDNLTGCIIDSVAFDTHEDTVPCARN